jgi:hypothetical protein
MTVLRRELAVYRRARSAGIADCPSGGRERVLRALLVLAPLDRRQRRWLHLEGGDLPAEGGQLARDRDGDDRVALAALALE